MKGKALWKHSLHGKKAASVLLELFISKAAIDIINVLQNMLGTCAMGLMVIASMYCPSWLSKNVSRNKTNTYTW